MMTEIEVEVFGCRERRQRTYGAREDGKTIGREESLPNGVGLGGVIDETRYQMETARVPRTRE